MIIPMLVKIDFGALHQVKGHVGSIGVTLAINWPVEPLSMAFLAWLFIRVPFAPMLPADQLDSYIAGLILLAAVHAPRWCSSGAASPAAIPISRSRKWRSTT
jgi:ACR3 family arsenite transporter